MEKQITIKLGDNNNKNYSRIITLTIPAKMYNILSNFHIENDYDEMWDNMCDLIDENYPTLPRNWFIDKITW